jgi:type IV secretory pathway TrbD component
MDIIILFLLVVTGGLMLRGAPRGLILTSWFITAVLILALFKHHATSALNLSF